MRTPLSSAPAISSGFDLKRKHPIYGTVIPHTGVDYSVPVGTPVLASASGVVVRSTYDPPRSKGGTGAGNLVGINHDNGLGTRYYHLSRRDVVVGQRVRAGQRVGLSGNTGDSTGPHLHFEIRTGGYWGTPVNPVPYLSMTKEVIMTDVDLNVDQRIGLAKGGRVSGALNGLTSISVGGSLSYAAGGGWQAMTRLPRIEARLTAIEAAMKADRGIDADTLALDVAAALAPLIVSEVVAGVGSDVGLTAEQVEAAAERAMRSVLGSLAAED